MTNELSDLFSSAASFVLAIEGAANRAANTVGMAAVLEEEGLTSRVEKIYGVSSGAFVGAAIVAGKARQAASIFINSDIRRFMTAGLPRYDLDRVFAEQNGLLSFTQEDYHAIAASGRLCVVAYKALDAFDFSSESVRARDVGTETGTIALLDIGPQSSPTGVKKTLQAGAHFPWAVVGTDLPKGYYDGAIGDNNGIVAARADRPAARVVALTNRPWGQPVNDSGLRKAQAMAVSSIAMLSQMGVAEGIKAFHSFRSNMDFYDKKFPGWYRGEDEKILVVAPAAGAQRLRQEEVRTAVLAQGVFDGMLSVYAALSPDAETARARATKLFGTCKRAEAQNKR